MQPEEPKTLGEFEQIVDGLKNSNNVLVTISTDPTVDQFAACIGLTLVLNKLGKHANAVFSGAIPSTIDFLKPEETIEKNTNSLRDFIIALDKSKADKLRYKVEDNVVKIFITPYRTSISEEDLEYSQGDFNIDAIVAIGVQEKNHLDAAILNHGRILHDATVMTINTKPGAKLGSINWADEKVSSLCEMIADVARDMSKDIFDKQNATALLTGIVAETDRYSNEKATPHTMSIAGILMSAGASTQLVSTKLDAQKEEVLPPVAPQSEEQTQEHDGMIEIQHEGVDSQAPPVPSDDEKIDLQNQIEIDDQGSLIKPEESQSEEKNTPKGRVISEPPSMGGQLTANSEPTDQQYSASTDPLSNLPEQNVINRKSPDIEPLNAKEPEAEETSENVSLTLDVPSKDKNKEPAPEGTSLEIESADAETEGKTLAEIEETVGRPNSVETESEEIATKEVQHDETDDVPADQESSDTAAETTDSADAIEEARKAVELAEENVEADQPAPEPREDIGSVSFDPNAPVPKPLTASPQSDADSAEESSEEKKEDKPASNPPPDVPPPFVPGS